MPKIITTEDYLQKCVKVHGDKYDLSKVVYKSSKDLITIGCKDHGLFEMRASVFLRANCPKCSKNNSKAKLTLSQEDFVNRSNKIHNNKYSYEKVKYKNTQTKVIITCKEHGDFKQIPSSHLLGMGCRKCANIVMREKTIKNQDFFDNKIEESGLKDIYDFSEAIYVDTNTKVKVICSEHGPFHSLPNNLYKGHGCRKCGFEKASNGRRDTTESFIEKALKLRGDLCDYSLVDYIDSHTKIKIICKKHGVFECSPNSHLTGSGTSCPDCNKENISSRSLKNTDHFIAKSKKVHGDYYDYSESEYKGDRVNVKIICPSHGPFMQRPSHHFSGSGCSGCQNFGFRTNLPSYLYVMRSDNICKIGICNREPHERNKNINKSSGLNFKVIKSWKFEDGMICKDLESHYLNVLRDLYNPIQEIFDGSTECFYNVNINRLIDEINEHIEEMYAY